MKINKDLIYSNLLYNKEIHYSDKIILHPVKMNKIIGFQQYQQAITIRKDSMFADKKIIKMSYFDFLKFAHNNIELANTYKSSLLPYCWEYSLLLFEMVCKDADVKYNSGTLDISINDEIITPDIFDDLRKIIILQNDIDFDIDEFINKDTLDALEKARQFEEKKSKEKSDIEDYIDSMVVGLKVTEEYIENLTIRKFWRYIKRLNKHEEYQSIRTASMSGMVTFKEPIVHWMTTLDVVDKYSNLKTDEKELKSKVG